LITKLCPTPYLPAARCPIWEGTIRAIFSGKQSILDYMQRVCGYILTGEVREQILLIAYGRGSNGKTTFINQIMATMGEDYAIKASRDLFMARKQDTHPTQIARLFGKRFVACVETEQKGQLDEALVKELTGSDPLTARRMREDPWQFMPT